MGEKGGLYDRIGLVGMDRIGRRIGLLEIPRHNEGDLMVFVYSDMVCGIFVHDFAYIYMFLPILSPWACVAAALVSMGAVN
jgi:hypothetical protein